MVVTLGLVATLVLCLSSRGRPGLRRLRYKRQPDGTYTRVVGDVRVTYRAAGRWTVRIGLYTSCDFVAEPRRGSHDGDYTFASGVPALDRRFRWWSERPPFAKAVLARPPVQQALLAFPRRAVISLHGDELVVEDRWRSWGNHERVVRLARAISAASRPS